MPNTPKKKKLSPEERKRLETQLAELQEALSEEEEATTPAEQAAAEADLAEQRRRTAELFDKLDLTEEDFELLVASVATGSREQLRAIVREELEASGEQPEGGTVAELETDPTAPPVEKDAPPEPGPDSKHWTEKRLWGKDEVKP